MRKYFAPIIVWFERLRVQGRLWRDLNTAESENLVLRGNIAWRDRDIQALNRAIENMSHDPPADAERLLRLADQLFSERGNINAWELRCWRDEYWQHVMRKHKSTGRYFNPFDGAQ